MFLALVTTAVWADLPGVFTPDTLPALYSAPARLLGTDLSSWVADPFLGQPNLQVGRAPVSATLAALAATGLPDWALVRLWQCLLLIVAALGARALYRRWAGADATAAGALAMAVVYTANPYVVVGGATTPTLLPYALLPWAAIALHQAIDHRGWRAPAAFALVFFAMSGFQVGVVPLLQLLVVPCLVLDARIRRQVPWRSALGGVARCGALALLLSAYWLVPSLQGVAQGSAVAAATESGATIAGPSSAAEVVRGLGMWTMYGRDGSQPFQPGFISYLTNPFVVVASFALPTFAALGAVLSRSRLRGLGVLLIGVAVPVMVGQHPYDRPTPFGRLLQRGFDDIPGLIAFRTTNKAGGVLLLGLSLLVALGVQAIVPRVRGARGRALMAGVAAALLLGSVAPAVAGPLHPVRLEVPAYWKRAASALDSDVSAGRILVLPGTQIPRYRWGYTSPADFVDGLFSRGTIQRQTVPNGSAQAADLLAALDTALQEGRLEPRTLSDTARRLGVRDILVRHDLNWERVGGARPSDIAYRVSTDPGLELVETFGRPGQNVTTRDALTTPDQARAEAALPPLQHFRLRLPSTQVHAESAGGGVLVDGDNTALPDLMATGLLPPDAGYRLLAGSTPAELERALRDGARVVLTDTNRRREAGLGRLTGGGGPTVEAHQRVERLVTPFADSDTQSVAVLSGASLSATQSGSLFGPVPYGGPALAFDGDNRTAWLAGDFGSARGQRLDLRFRHPVHVFRVVLRPAETFSPRLAGVDLRVGSVVRHVALSPGTDTVVNLPPADVTSASVTIRRVEGTGAGAVGLAELSLTGVPIEPAVRLPRTLVNLARRMSMAGRGLLEAAPLDVVLSRSRSLEDVSTDDEENLLSRDFATVGVRNYDVGGVVRAGADVSETALDLLAGYDSQVSATSSSRFFDNPALRASAALDGDASTAWVPGRDAIGESLTVAFPARPINTLVIEQERASGQLVDLATRVRVELQDGRSVEARLGPGVSKIALPPGRPVGLLRITILARTRTGVLVRINEVKIPGLQLRPDETRAAGACVTVGALSGAPLRVHAAITELVARRPTPFVSCGYPIRLGPGEQHLRTVPGWLLDRVHLKDVGVLAQGLSAVPAHLVATSHDATSWRVNVGEAHQPYLLVLGQGWDPRWQATVNGRDLGRPLVLDGWSTGWRIDERGPAVVRVRYGPERFALGARALSGAGLLTCLVLVLGRRRKPLVASAQIAETQESSHRASRARTLSTCGIGVGLLWAVGGTLLVGVGALVMLASRRSAGLARASSWTGVLLLAAVPFLRIFHGLGDRGDVSPALVTGGLSERCALLGVTLLVVGVLAQEWTRRDRMPQ